MKICDIFDESSLHEILESRPDYRGGYANVYKVGGYVLKVFKQDIGYSLFIDFIKKCSQIYNNTFNQHLPKIYDHIECKGLNVVLMEKLDTIKEESIIFLQMEAETKGWCERDIQPWVGISNTLDNVLYELEEFGGKELENMVIDWDLHCYNIMERDGVLVIIDPWV